MDPSHRPDRFRDPSTWLQTLAAEDIDVVCPYCESRATVTVQQADRKWPARWPRRFVCTTCVSTASWSSKESCSHWGSPADPFFGLPLWWRAGCCGGRTLWAFNDAHLALLANYVGARLRERADPGMTMVARLPKWMKSAKNRDELLRTIARLRDPHITPSRRPGTAPRHPHKADRPRQPASVFFERARRGG